MHAGHAGSSTPPWLIPVAIGAVIVVGVGIAVVRMALSKKKGGQVDGWAHAAYSLWTGGEDSATWTQKRAQDSLRSWYGAASGGAFQEVVKGLREGTTGNAAWDKVRALDLVRIGAAAAYYDADQVRAQQAGIGSELQRIYGSWDELAREFEAGMQAWQRSRGTTDPKELGRVQRNLPKLRSDIWPRIPYKTPLAGE